MRRSFKTRSGVRVKRTSGDMENDCSHTSPRGAPFGPLFCAFRREGALLSGKAVLGRLRPNGLMMKRAVVRRRYPLTWLSARRIQWDGSNWDACPRPAWASHNHVRRKRETVV